MFCVIIFLHRSFLMSSELRCTINLDALFAAAIPPTTLYIEPITEERANRCLARIDLLNRLREDILWHARLEDRLKLCQPALEMPEWWQPGTHDKELLIGACK